MLVVTPGNFITLNAIMPISYVPPKIKSVPMPKMKVPIPSLGYVNLVNMKVRGRPFFAAIK